MTPSVRRAEHTNLLQACALAGQRKADIRAVRRGQGKQALVQLRGAVGDECNELCALTRTPLRSLSVRNIHLAADGKVYARHALTAYFRHEVNAVRAPLRLPLTTQFAWHDAVMLMPGRVVVPKGYAGTIRPQSFAVFLATALSLFIAWYIVIWCFYAAPLAAASSSGPLFLLNYEKDFLIVSAAFWTVFATLIGSSGAILAGCWTAEKVAGSPPAQPRFLVAQPNVFDDPHLPSDLAQLFAEPVVRARRGLALAPAAGAATATSSRTVP